MITRFDHAILAVDSLPRSITGLRDRFGFDVNPGGKHTGLGTENAILRFGLDYIELLGVYDRQEVLAAGVKRSSLLDFIDKKGGGWLAFCMATDNIKGLAQRFSDIGLRSLGPYNMERVRPDGVVLKWQLLVPEHSAWRKPWPFFIQWETPDEERIKLELPGQHKCGDCKVSGVRLVVKNVAAAEYLYIEQLGFDLRSHNQSPLPGTQSAELGLGDFTVELISPTEPGPIQEQLDECGEGLNEVCLSVSCMNDELRESEAGDSEAGDSADSKVITGTVDLLSDTGCAGRARMALTERQ